MSNNIVAGVYAAPFETTAPQLVGDASAYTVILQLAQTIDALRSDLAKVTVDRDQFRSRLEEMRGLRDAAVDERDAARMLVDDLIRVTGAESTDTLVACVTQLRDCPMVNESLAQRDAMVNEGLACAQRDQALAERDCALDLLRRWNNHFDVELVSATMRELGIPLKKAVQF